MTSSKTSPPLSFSMRPTTSPPALRRRDSRRPTYAGVQWDHRQAEDVDGTLRDLTPKGTFLAPLGVMPSHVLPGETVWIVLKLGDRKLSLAATVRWAGWSDDHDARGFGLEFEEHSRAAAQEACLELDRAGRFFVPIDGDDDDGADPPSGGHLEFKS